MKVSRRFQDSLGLSVYLLLAGMIGLCVFKKFIFFQAAYLFKDVGSDSINIAYPQFVHLLDYWRKDGVPGWSFNQGLGGDIYPFSWNDPFLLVLFVFGKARLAEGIFWMEAAKIGAAGTFFYLYLREASLSKYAAVVGALLFSFSGYVVVGGGWTIFSSEAADFALLLYAFERFLARGDARWLPPPIALLGMLQPYFLAIDALFIATYGTARFIDAKGWQPKRYAIFVLRLAGTAAVGAAMGGFMLVSESLAIMQSPRTSGPLSLSSILLARPAFALEEAGHYATAVLRFFSNDLLGAGSHFSGWRNYLEAPLFYCGLGTLLLAPQSFAVMNSTRRKIYGTLTALCALPIILPYFRYAFWAFRADYYRTLALFVVVVLLYLAARALSDVEENASVRPKLLAGTLGGALLLLFVVPRACGLSVDAGRTAAVCALLIVEAGLLLLAKSRRLAEGARAGLLIMVCVEAAVFARQSVGDRDVVSAEELSQRTGYRDETVEAVAYLKSIDPQFYRIEKDYRSISRFISLNDAKVQDYFGTSSYSQFNQPSAVAFLDEFGLIKNRVGSGARWISGTGRSRRLMSLVGVKYLLSKTWAGEPGFPFADDPVARFGDVAILRNRRALPIGFTYARRFPVEKFRTLDAAHKAALLLNAFTVDEDAAREFSDFPEYALAAAAAEPTDRGFDEAVRARRAEPFVTAVQGQNFVSGTIELRERRLLFFSIPFDAGWRARVDGKAASLRRVDVGFMGLALDAGNHRVDLNYIPPGRDAGVLLSVAGLGLYALMLVAGSPRVNRGRSL